MKKSIFLIIVILILFSCTQPKYIASVRTEKHDIIKTDDINVVKDIVREHIPSLDVDSLFRVSNHFGYYYSGFDFYIHYNKPKQ